MSSISDKRGPIPMPIPIPAQLLLRLLRHHGVGHVPPTRVCTYLSLFDCMWLPDFASPAMALPREELLLQDAPRQVNALSEERPSEAVTLQGHNTFIGHSGIDLLAICVLADP
mmetsp:Transcript_6704/g.9840  ORF Transcript_6704/g.9840 Transcript_6704/m.9840 type:complete len:113 (-) Transcript_6704:85-423(-)